MTAEESSDKKMPPNEAESAASNAAATKMDPETEPLNAGATADPKVKFTGGATETVDVENGGLPAEDGIKPALTKAELMKYASDPFWVKMRWILFILFWIGWTAMLVTSIVIIIMAPKCPSPAPKSWWQKRPFYQIDVKSFRDSDGDGTGDLTGILDKVDYLDNNLGVGSVGLSPIFKNQDNYKTINEQFGTAEDFKKLVDGLHDREIKVVLDLFPTHSSTQAGELKNTMKFWLSQGADGFRVSSDAYQMDEEKTLVLLQEFRDLLDEAEENDEGSKILMTNVKSEDVTTFYGPNITDHVGSLSQMPVTSPNVLANGQTTAENLKNTIEAYTGSLPEDAWPNFSLGKHGVSRVATRTQPKLASTLNLLLMLLPGTPITYFGEEIGMVDVNGEMMQWNNLESEEENEEKRRTSLYLEGASLRESETILFGTTDIRVVDDVFILTRVKKGNPGYIFLSNLGNNSSTINVKEMEPKIDNMAEKGILTISIPQDAMEVGDTVAMGSIKLPPETTYLVTFVPDFD